MDNAQRKLISDILGSIQNIESYVGATKIFEEYDTNGLLQDAVERNLITIGEAMNYLFKINPALPVTNARRVVDARNKLTHGYDEIENLQVWNIIVNHLPLLKTELNRFLKL